MTKYQDQQDLTAFWTIDLQLEVSTFGVPHLHILTPTPLPGDSSTNHLPGTFYNFIPASIKTIEQILTGITIFTIILTPTKLIVK